MATWNAEFFSLERATWATGVLEVQDLGGGRAQGTLRELKGGVSIGEMALTGVVTGNDFEVGGDSPEADINLALYFAPYIFALVGSAQIKLRNGQKLALYVATRP